MENQWSENIDQFILMAHQHGVRMVLVGGGAVSFHGYQRHSVDVDFWVDTTAENFKKLVDVFTELGYDISEFPENVMLRKQNISVKFSPLDLDLELITNFSSSRTFDEAFENSVPVEILGNKILKYQEIYYDDLIDSKLKAQRPKDLLDIQQLQMLKS